MHFEQWRWENQNKMKKKIRSEKSLFVCKLSFPQITKKTHNLPLIEQVFTLGGNNIFAPGVLKVFWYFVLCFVFMLVHTEAGPGRWPAALALTLKWIKAACGLRRLIPDIFNRPMMGSSGSPTNCFTSVFIWSAWNSPFCRSVKSRASLDQQWFVSVTLLAHTVTSGQSHCQRGRGSVGGGGGGEGGWRGVTELQSGKATLSPPPPFSPLSRTVNTMQQHKYSSRLAAAGLLIRGRGWVACGGERTPLK